MKEFGLIGFPLSHSFSSNYFTAKFQNNNTANLYKYSNFELTNINGLNQLILENPLLAGLNVTRPYKEKVVPFMDILEPDADLVLSVNTIKINRSADGSINFLQGFNTDTWGFNLALKPLLKPLHTGALVLGTGGASKAICFVLKQLGIPFLMVSSSQKKHSISYNDIDQHLLDQYPIIVNTTPVGTFPNINDKPPLPYRLLSEKNLLFDLVYNPPVTAFMQEGKKYGAEVSNGYSMLVEQAEKSWEIWNS